MYVTSILENRLIYLEEWELNFLFSLIFMYGIFHFIDAYNEPASFMTGSFADATLQHPPHLPPPQEQYGAYGPYVHPPLGSDSGSGSGSGTVPPPTGYVPIPSGSFSPVTNNNPLDHHHHMEAWNNNERLETSYY